MPRYTDDSRERVRDAIDFAEVVGARTELRKTGPQSYMGRCPFHDERSPSFSVDPVKGLYHCFGCGVGGDVFRFVMETENVGFGEALELLADRFNVPLERSEEDPRAAERRGRRDRLLALLERTAAFYVRLLWDGEEAAVARDYLSARGLDEATLREFRVGYSPYARDRVVAGSRSAGYTDAELLAAGLASRAQGGALVDRFFGRLMFPLADPRGRVVGFGARALREGAQPKYLNSAEGEVFSKGRMVFGTHLARAEASKAGSVVLVEGYTDVIALHQAGIRNAVASMGTALTEGQAGELAKLAGTLVLCLDADAAGEKAMLRAAESVRAGTRGLEMRVVALPSGLDPADLVASEGVDAVRSLLTGAVPFARWRVERALERGGDSAFEEALTVIRPLPTSVLRDELVRMVVGHFALTEQAVADALASLGRGGGRVNGAGANGHSGARRKLDARTQTEHAFLSLCLAVPDAGPARLSDPGTLDLLASPLSRRAAEHLRDHADAPAAGLAPDDADLSQLVAALVLRARELEPAEPAELDRAALMLDLARLDRDIAAARLDQNPVTDLATERQRVLSELRRLTR